MRAKRFQLAIMISCLALMTPPNALALRLVSVKTVTPADQERLYKQLMAQTIKHIDGVCSLTDRQKRKLTIASKGAVDRAMTKLKPIPPRNQFGRVEVGFPEVRIVRDVVEPQNAIQVLNGPRLTTWSRTVWQVSSVMNESIWTKTLVKVLTAEQKAKLNLSKKNRTALPQTSYDQQFQLIRKLLSEVELPPNQ
jgi:hypothetical protein